MNASYYAFPNFLLIAPNYTIHDGPMVTDAPYTILKIDASHEEIGTAIAMALSKSSLRIPFTKDYKSLSKRRHEAAKVKTESEFQKKSRLVSIKSDLNGILLTPTRNGGSSGTDKGFHYLIDLIINLPYPVENEAIGKAAKEQCDLLPI